MPNNIATRAALAALVLLASACATTPETRSAASIAAPPSGHHVVIALPRLHLAPEPHAPTLPGSDEHLAALTVVTEEGLPDGWLALERASGEEHCLPTLEGLSDMGIRFYARADALETLTTQRIEGTIADTAPEPRAIAINPGQVLRTAEDGALLVNFKAYGGTSEIRFNADADALGTHYAAPEGHPEAEPVEGPGVCHDLTMDARAVLSSEGGEPETLDDMPIPPPCHDVYTTRELASGGTAHTVRDRCVALEILDKGSSTVFVSLLGGGGFGGGGLGIEGAFGIGFPGAWSVKPGATVRWFDGTPVGTTTAPILFFDLEREDVAEDRVCIQRVLAMETGSNPSVVLCFDPADVEPPEEESEPASGFGPGGSP